MVETSSNTDTNVWCPKLLTRYHEQRRAQASVSNSTYSEREKWTTQYFLQRILEHAQHQQQQNDEKEEELAFSKREIDDDAKQTTVAVHEDTTCNDNPTDNSPTSSIASDDLQVPVCRTFTFGRGG